MENSRGLTLCVVGVLLMGCATLQSSEQAEKKINTLLIDSIAAWNAGDLEQFVVPYALDARFISKTGVVTGRKVIYDRYKKKYSNRQLMGELSIDFRPITFSPGDNPQSATVIGNWRIKRTNGEVLQGYTLIVLHKLKGRWVIIEDHSS